LDVSLYKQIPLSGSVPERWYDAHGSCIWVRFAPEGQPEWAGVFGRGLNGGYIQAVPFADRRTAMVIAGGQGYIIDAHTGELLHKTDHDLFCDAITIPFHDFVIACDYTQLFAVSRLGVIWQSPRLALDEIKLDYAMQRTMSGQAMHLDGWQDFWLTYQAWQLCAKPLKHR
jgi:hypothetical protein